MSRHTMSWPARIGVIALASASAAVLSGAVATAHAASDAAPAVTTYEVFRETVKPWDSITIPSRMCPTGFLHDHDYSPGRLVPRGVEIVEPGGVGVTITHSDGPVWVENGRLVKPITGYNADHSYSGATNWDPFSSHEVVVKLHCTVDTDHAVVEDLGPSPI